MCRKEWLDHQLALWRVPGIGPVRYHHIMQRVRRDGLELWRDSRALLKACGLSPGLEVGFQRPDWRGVARDRAWLAESKQHHIVMFEETAYPALLRHIYDPPPLLFVEGNLRVLQQSRILAMVGSRKATDYGLGLAYRFGRALATYDANWPIVSGLALGIDAMSHRGVLDASGTAIAVFANGVDATYPKRHRRLRSEIIAQGGAVVSEFPCGVRPQPHYFPRRNRIISGLSHGVLVVESGLKSGSLVTARLALEQGREVMSIPGSIDQAMSAGNHRLIQQGAKLVTDLADILEELPIRGLTGAYRLTDARICSILLDQCKA